MDAEVEFHRLFICGMNNDGNTMHKTHLICSSLRIEQYDKTLLSIFLLFSYNSYKQPLKRTPKKDVSKY